MTSMLEALEKAFVKLRRKRVARTLFHKHGGIIQAGAFKGLALDGESNISQGPLAIKIFGLYETAVMERIVALGPFNDAINIGAADGYFSLGLLRAGLAQRSICFEMTAAGRAAIQRNAERNGLADRVVILGTADENIGQLLAPTGFSPARSLVLCDIEGGEFTVLSRSVLEQLSGAVFIVELHDRIQTGRPDQRQALLERFTAHYDCTIIQTVPVNWAGIADIEALSDNDRALATSEGRRAIGEWLVATPRT